MTPEIKAAVERLDRVWELNDDPDVIYGFEEVEADKKYVDDLSTVSRAYLAHLAETAKREKEDGRYLGENWLRESGLMTPIDSQTFCKDFGNGLKAWVNFFQHRTRVWLDCQGCTMNLRDVKRFGQLRKLLEGLGG